MLLSLHIENLAVIKCVDIDFSSGFTAITGETGAGKSVIIDGIRLLLGGKGDKELVRSGESVAMVSGVFSSLSDSTLAILREAGIEPDEDGSLIIQRTLQADGRSTVKINGRTVTLAIIKAISQGLIAIHGQSDTATLTDPMKQLEIIDTYAECGELLKEYKEAYSKLESLRSKIKELSEKEKERERLIEILEYQINDIDSYNLEIDEEEKLVDKKLKIKNSEKITKNAGFAFKALKGSEKGSVSYLLDRSATALSQISDVIPDFQGYSEQLRDFLYQIDDIAEEVYAQISDIDEDSDASLNEIESRLDKISRLKRKYGLTIKDILDFRNNASEELDSLKNSDELIEKLIKEELVLYKEAEFLATKLHERRAAAATEIEARVKETLEFLDMPKVVFFTSIVVETDSVRKALSSFGYDNLEFYISANRGAEAQPLSKVASGGELARVMLAIKSVIADKDGTSTVIFDEIDAGVSGKTARKIGIKLLSLSKNAQIFSVTHSAQIASLSDTHYLIGKSDVNGATVTHVSVLDYEGRVSELSRILGGINVTQSQRSAAIDMLEERKSYN